MNIIIDIPEDRYKEILQGDYIPDGNFRRNMIEAVRIGTPLPKGHGRLIDADTYRKEMLDSREFDFFKRLDMQPTIIEADKESEE